MKNVFNVLISFFLCIVTLFSFSACQINKQSNAAKSAKPSDAVTQKVTETPESEEATFKLPIYQFMPEFDEFVNEVIGNFIITDHEKKAYDSKRGMECFNISKSALFFFTYEIINGKKYVESFSVTLSDPNASRQTQVDNEFSIGFDIVEKLIGNLPSNQQITYDSLNNNGKREVKASSSPSLEIKEIKKDSVAMEALVSFTTPKGGNTIYLCNIIYDFNNQAEIEVDESTYKKYSKESRNNSSTTNNRDSLSKTNDTNKSTSNETTSSKQESNVSKIDSTETDYLVKVRVGELYVRSGPGTNYPTVSSLYKDQQVSVEGITDGDGSKSGWGKISSPEGWISLDYVDKVNSQAGTGTDTVSNNIITDTPSTPAQNPYNSTDASGSSQSNTSTQQQTTKPGHTHSFVNHPGKQPTCTERGWYDYSTCSCGYSDYQEIPSTGHNYQLSVQKDPTCTTDGIMTYICTKCMDSYQTRIPSTGHDMRCTVCSKCGYTNFEIIRQNIQYGLWSFHTIEGQMSLYQNWEDISSGQIIISNDGMCEFYLESDTLDMGFYSPIHQTSTDPEIIEGQEYWNFDFDDSNVTGSMKINYKSGIILVNLADYSCDDQVLEIKFTAKEH